MVISPMLVFKRTLFAFSSVGAMHPDRINTRMMRGKRKMFFIG
jgi:hypothetical protein